MFSIIVPVYNVENHLKRCIDSLIYQTFQDIEIVLIDDGSTDGSGQICDVYAEFDSRIVVVHKPNGGLSSARNEGIERATHDYILFVDSDDYIEQKTCEILKSSIENLSPDIIVGNAREIINGKSGEIFEYPFLNTHTLYTSKEFLKKSILNNTVFVMSWLFIYKKEFLKEKKLLFMDNIFHEDVEFFPRVFLSTDKILYMKYRFYNYEIHSSSIMTSEKNREKRINDLSVIYGKWKNLIEKLEDNEERQLLYGILIKMFLASCRTLNITYKWYPKGFDNKFVISYSLNKKEKLKALLYSISPKLYSCVANSFYKK